MSKFASHVWKRKGPQADYEPVPDILKRKVYWYRNQHWHNPKIDFKWGIHIECSRFLIQGGTGLLRFGQKLNSGYQSRSFGALKQNYPNDWKEFKDLWEWEWIF